MSLLSRLKPAGASGFGYGSTAEQVTDGLDLSGKSVLVTGCSSGLGRETGRVLALRGCHVLGTARTLRKAKEASASWPSATPLACELSDPQSIVACAGQIVGSGTRLDAIICNAGIMGLPVRQHKLGIELQLLTNHFGHALLLQYLLPILTTTGRVIIVSSNAHRRAPRVGIEFDNLSGERNYRPLVAYGQSKLANLLYAKALAKRLPKGQVANALHPGVIKTNIARSQGPAANLALGIASALLLKDAAEGAATQVWAAVHPEASRHNGAYLRDCNEAQPKPNAQDEALAERLWQETEAILARINPARAHARVDHDSSKEL